MQISFATFLLLKLGWSTEVKHSKQLARIARIPLLEEEREGTTQKVG